MSFYEKYKGKYHFLLNFYSFFLLVTFIPDILGVSSSIFTNGIWLIRVVMATFLIIRHQKKIYDLKWEEKLFLLVASIYFLNILVDVYLQYYPVGIGKPIDLIGFSLCILVAFSFRYDPSFSSKHSYFYFLTTLTLGLTIAFFIATPSPAPLIGRFDANSTVNTINYGKTGCALCLIAIYGFNNLRFKLSNIIYLVVFVLGVLSIMKAGSRSPVVILLVVFAIYFITKYNFFKGILIITISLLVLWSSIGILIKLSEIVDSEIVNRILASIESGDTSGRDGIYKNVLSIIRDSPLFGDFYIIPSGLGKGLYPHNYFLEVFMTTGLVGGIPFLLMIVLSLKRSLQLLNMKHETGWIVLLYLQSFFYGMFSSNLYSAEDFWGLCFLVLSINLIEDKNKRYQQL